MTVSTADTTLTVRIPRSWVGRVSASFVREGLRRFLAHPIKLPQYQGSLEARMSWRLPEEDLRRIGLEGHRGEMVRRIVAAELRSARHPPPAFRLPVPLQPKDTDIVSEEVIGEDASGCVIIMQRDRRGFGYQRILPMDRETYLKARHV